MKYSYVSEGLIESDSSSDSESELNQSYEKVKI